MKVCCKPDILADSKKHSTGALPFAGPGLNIYASDTYHMATLIGIYEYYLFTNDSAFMSANWDKYVKAVSYITRQIDNTGLLFVTGTQDWGRDGQGGHNTEANMLMYKTLTTASSIATWMGDLSMSSNLSTMAATLKDAVNVRLWDAVGGYEHFVGCREILLTQMKCLWRQRRR